ncbi:MAG: class I tRNA ligase family protein, partial [Anaerolineae bacterium]
PPMFDRVTPQNDWPAMERRILAWWKETDAFGMLVRQNAGAEPWSFQDGPITANNPMGVHHAWGRSFKDVWSRFFSMQGRDLRWQNGFDCQGLWVEVEVEKSLGFKSKRDIEAYGIDAFVRRCKERVLRYAAVQTEQSIRLGMWMHWDDPADLRFLADHIDEAEALTVDTPAGPVTATVEQLVGQLGKWPWNKSYFTFADTNNYLIWRFLKECHRRGWVYRGRDVMPWCARCGTGLSQHEIATEGYQDLTHKSPTVRFPLVDRPGESLLVWTTTPWTLSANVSAAVGPELTYLKVRQGDDILYLAKGAAKAALKGKEGQDWTVEAELRGADMVGWRYRGPYDHLPAAAPAVEGAHTVIAWEEVGEAEGTGIVHIAPGCGAEDFGLSKRYDLPVIAPLDESGIYGPDFGWLAGRLALDVAQEVVDDLKARELLYKVEGYKHRYPTCWRCGSELVFRLVDEWFISMGPLYDLPREAVTEAQKAASLRYQMMDVVDAIRWIPGFGRERELDWLRNMHDWMISKKRYWGLALPIWVCQDPDCGWFTVVGSKEELSARAVAGWEVFEGHSPHRPYVDAVEVLCEECGGPARRVRDVGNPWLDAGIVSLSTLPADPADEEAFAAAKARWFPADFITESFPGQFRNWFYSLLAMSTVLEGQAPFKTVLGFATLFAEDGREMHKSWGNAIEFNEAADTMGADVMRWMYLAHRPEQNLNFGYGPGTEVRRRFLIPLWNVYGFFVQYANLAEGWSAPRAWDATRPAGRAPAADEAARELDRWILARQEAMLAELTERMADYDGYKATAAVEAFVEELSNWYVRRSRRRFWEGEAAALDTLYTVLVTLSRALAPMLPFSAEELYQNLVRRGDEGAPESVHHCLWPMVAAAGAAGAVGGAAGSDRSDAALITDMNLVLRLAALGREARARQDLKLRQPLARATVAVRSVAEEAALGRLGGHLLEELNVKALEVVRDGGSLVTYSLRPVLPKLGPRFGKAMGAVRAALAAVDAAAAAVTLAAGEPLTLTVDGEAVTLQPDEVEVMAAAQEGRATAGQDGYVVEIDQQLTPELVAEGLARDLVRQIQELRKQAGLQVTDRIALYLTGSPELEAAARTWQGFITGETLATELHFAPAPEDAQGRAEVVIEGQAVGVGVRRVAATIWS